jgi:hypothetical protein
MTVVSAHDQQVVADIRNDDLVPNELDVVDDGVVDDDVELTQRTP